jgi:hypothetical protein
MRKSFVFVVLVATAAAAFAVFAGSAAALAPPVTTFIQSCVTTDGVPYITDGVPEDESDCEASDAVLADPTGFGFSVTPLCIQGTTYLYADDDPADEFVFFLQDLGYSATFGACPTPPQTNNTFLCYSTFEQDSGMVVDTSDYADLVKQGYWKPDAVLGTAPSTAYTQAGKYYLSCNPSSSLKPSGLGVDLSGEAVFPWADPAYSNAEAIFQIVS